MNNREKYLSVCRFEKVDKVPISLGDFRRDVLKRWWKEGLPKKANPEKYFGFADKSSEGSHSLGLSISSYPQAGGWGLDSNKINLGPIPAFKQQILTEDKRYRVWIDQLGITQKGLRRDWEKGWTGFATRVFIDFPVKNREDYINIKKRYRSDNSGRYPKNWLKLVKKWQKRSYPIGFSLRGPFWFTRDMMGMHQTLIEMYRNPEFIREVMDFSTEFHIECLSKAVKEVEVDFVWINEDMGYHKGPMMSPNMAKKLILPCYIRLCKFFTNHGIEVINLDSDGNVKPLIPIWLKGGINGIGPCEVAANMDILSIRKKYPQLIIYGGIDKRKLSQGKKDIEEELYSKIPYMIERGGYFPGVDHAVPADVSLENYKFFIFLLKKICGWK